MPRGRGWSEEEEVSLALAWLEVSEDAKKGTDRKKGDFWDVICVRYKEIFRMRSGASEDGEINSRSTQCKSYLFDHLRFHIFKKLS